MPESKLILIKKLQVWIDENRDAWGDDYNTTDLLAEIDEKIEELISSG